MQYKCVSKPWRSLISTSSFAKLHLRRVLQDTSLDHHKFFINSIPFQSIDPEGFSDATQLSLPSRTEDIEADFNILKTQLNIGMMMPESDVDLVGSCDGLICAILDLQRFVVFNPTTRQARELPLPDSFLDGEYFSGFGFDSQVDDYKIVVGVMGENVEIFNLKSNNWRTISIRDDYLSIPGVFANGVLHWIARQDNQIDEMVRFDLAEEKFLPNMQFPDQIRKLEYLSGDLKLIGNCLCVSTECGQPTFEAWMMEEYGDDASWTKLVSFRTEPLPGSSDFLRFLWVTKTGHVVFHLDGCFTVVFDPKEGSVKLIWIPNERNWCNAIMYVESLFSPMATDNVME